MIRNYGLKISKEKDPQAFVLGGLTSLPKVILQADGQWDAYLPEREVQYNDKFDTYNCTAYGTTAIVETLAKRLGYQLPDRSDRYLGIMAETKPPGNDPHKVSQVARDFGLIAEASLPFKDLYTVSEYYSFKGAEAWKCDLEAQEFQNTLEVGHEYVFQGRTSREERTKKMKEALLYSPLGISVTAWSLRDGVYVDDGKPNTHWTMCYGWNDKGWKVFDSYDQTLKIVSYDHNIQICKRYSLTKSIRKQEISILKKLIEALSKLLGLVAKQEAIVATVVVLPPVQPVVEAVKVIPPSSKYDWDTPILARHSVRVICDEEKLTTTQKNELCATVGAESGWKPRAIGAVNFDGTRDYGIVQINPKYWIGKGKKFPSTDYVLNNPEACVRWMCQEWKRGNRNWWYGYKNGGYKSYL